MELTFEFDRLYIGGAWVASPGSAIEVLDSVTEQPFARIPLGTPDDVDAAVAAARRAFDTWSTAPRGDRADLLEGAAAALEAKAGQLAWAISRETGMAEPLSRAIQVGLPVRTFRSAAALLRDYEFEEVVGNSLVVREPIGVVGCITPWNYPLHQIAAKVAYALAAGCKVVLKPSEVAPVGAFVLAEVLHEGGLPAGVFNLVSGTGPVVGEAIAGHRDVDMVSFTGSTRAGRRVAQLAAEHITKVTLELGGKSANVILDDLTGPAFAGAVRHGVGRAYLNSGQTCSALTRLLVPRTRLAEAEAAAADAAAELVMGDPAEPGVQLGPLATAAQRDRVQQYIRTGIAEGAKLVVGGPERPDCLPTGYFVRPTVFSDVRAEMTIAQEEIFGPVLSILPYDDDAHALDIANGVVYGLSGGVWSADAERALTFARQLRTGQVEINGGAFNPDAPFGGYKQSGIGREYGRHGFEEFLEVKSMQR